MPSNLNLVGAKLRRAFSLLPYFPRTLRLVRDAAPGWTVAWVALLAVQGLLPAATVTLTRSVVDSLVPVLRRGATWQTIWPALLPLGLMAVVLLVGGVLRSVAGWVRATLAELVQDHIRALIHHKSVEVDLAYYDLPDYFDHLHRAQNEASYRPMMLLGNLGTMLQHGITLVAMVAVLLRYGVWLPIALVASTLPAFFVLLHHRLRLYRWRLLATAPERRSWYYDWLLTARQTAAEMRVLDLGAHFQAAYEAVRGQLRGERRRLARDQALAEATASACGLLVTAGAGLWMVWRTTQQQTSLGDLALFFQAFNQGQGLAGSLLASVGEAYSNSLFLGDLFEFLALDRKVVEQERARPAPSPLQQGIVLDHVGFRYPGSQRAALRDFSLTIPAGRITAVVGRNGAGKSTLVKLLCRLYDPDAGAVQIDGVDLRQMRVREVRRLVTVLMQEPVQYSATLAENVALGDLAASPGTAAIASALEEAGANDIVARLPDGHATLLGKWFAGGTDLSVGEWQRIALARAFQRRAPIMILDEPTSAMDPWAEADWLERFRALAQGRTALIITHRFTTAMYADCIHVMDDGRVIESGAHQDLLAKGGAYARAWQRQMRTGGVGS
jgi:ATP-binding cassette, subfamily B, bacterial